MRSVAALLFAALLAVSPAYAHRAHGAVLGGRVHGSSSVASCPKGSSFTDPYLSVGDGCAGANQNAEFSEPNYFTDGLVIQSGQTWNASSPWSWNVPGFNYPVGYDTTITMKDPSSATLPSGCTYSATGSSAGGPLVTCFASASPDFEGFDFCGNLVGSHGAVELYLHAVTGTATINNSNICNDLTQDNSSGGTALIYSITGSENIVITNSKINGLWPTATKMANLLILNVVTGSITLKYNDIRNPPGRPISTNTSGNISARYNYIYSVGNGPVSGGNGIHGEFIARSVTADKTYAQDDYVFNACINPSSIAGVTTPGTINPCFWFSDNRVNSVWTTAYVSENIFVANKSGSLVQMAAAGGSFGPASNFVNLYQANNYYDPTGAYSCSVLVSGVTGMAATTVGQAANQVNITAATGTILINSSLIAGNFSRATLTSQVSGPAGGTPGVYVYSGADQSSAGALTSPVNGSPIATYTETGNVDLLDGSTVSGFGKPASSQGVACFGHG